VIVNQLVGCYTLPLLHRGMEICISNIKSKDFYFSQALNVVNILSDGSIHTQKIRLILTFFKNYNFLFNFSATRIL
jgi:hypothetical protein